MSPKTRSSLVNITAFIGAVTAVAGLAGGTKALADNHYVRADTFREYRIEQAGHAAFDSLKHQTELEKIDRQLASQDTMLREVRATLRRMEQRGR